MKIKIQLAQALTLAAALSSPSLALATNGYFSHGYGATSLGAAGVGIAAPQDTLAAATNPAGFVGNRIDLGLSVFAPRRSSDIQGNAFGPNATYSGDGKKTFFVPEFGYSTALNANTQLGVAVYGNCGLNTDYTSNPYARFQARGDAGVNLEQLLVSPSIAYKLNDSNSIGVAANLAYQRFSAKGIGLFGGFSTAPGNVSDQGNDTSTGAGVRIGWIGKVAPGVSLGATWASKISGKFDKYKGLFSDSGKFDIPENFGAGIAVDATPDLTLAADVQTIRYSKVSAVGNSAALLFAAGRPLGSANGPGFGWRDVTVTKLGVTHRFSRELTIRGGVSFANQTVPAAETFFSVLAPGVIRKHLTAGFTWNTTDGELTAYYALGLGTTVNGSGSIPAGFPPAGLGGGNANIRLKENIIGVAYAWKQ